MDLFSEALVELHKEGRVSDIDFLFVYSYMMTRMNLKDLARRYVVGFDTPAPTYASRQYIHFGVVRKVWKLIDERVREEHNIHNIMHEMEQREVASQIHPKVDEPLAKNLL